MTPRTDTGNAKTDKTPEPTEEPDKTCARNDPKVKQAYAEYLAATEAEQVVRKSRWAAWHNYVQMLADAYKAEDAK